MKRQPASGQGAEHSRQPYRAMFRSLVRRMVVVSLLPLVVIGGVNFYLFFHLNRTIVADQHASALRYHRQAIEAFLDNLTSEISTLAHQYSLAELKAGDLERVFAVIKQQAGVFTDIGVIDSGGNHVKYVGPYDLGGKNYRDTDWFRQVVERGIYASDMFLGYRGVPHFVIAVRRGEEGDFWILRATVNTDYFSKMVDAGHTGRTGEAYILNRDGVHQTKTRFSERILVRSSFPDLDPHADIKVRELVLDGKHYLVTTTWLTSPRWLLVYRQEVGDAYAPLTRATAVGIVIILIGALGTGAFAAVVARRQVHMLRRANDEKEALTQQLLVAGRIAAVGELSAGVAHEINNPLATIDTLRTWIQDLSVEAPVDEDDRSEIVESAQKIGVQVERCKTITQGLLKFSRRVESTREPQDIREILDELATMARTRARVEGVTLVTELAPTAPVMASAVHLQQIFANLVNNAIDAVAGRPRPEVKLTLREAAGRIEVAVADNGCGIAPENMSRIFSPFFTTKPVGRGTGLGLAICYGLVSDLGGTIQVRSAADAGTTFTVTLVPVGAASRAGGAA